MPGANVHVDKLLSNFASVSAGKGMPHIWPEVYPMLPVVFESDKFKKFFGEFLNTNIDDLRADGDVAKEMFFKSTDGQYVTEERALSFLITDRMKNNSDNIMKLDQRITKRLMGQIMTGIEKRVAARLNDANIFTQTQTIVNQWDGTTDPDIEGDVDTAKETLRKLGFPANKIIFPSIVEVVVKKDPTIRELLKHTHSTLVTNGDLPPTMWNMKKITAGSIENQGNVDATESLADIWATDNVYVCHVPPVSLDYTGPGFYPVVSTFGPRGWQTRQWRENKRRGKMVETAFMGSPTEVNVKAMVVLKNALK